MEGEGSRRRGTASVGDNGVTGRDHVNGNKPVRSRSDPEVGAGSGASGQRE